jgi:phosphoribosylformimino-5-aminoimidazole carboxamide ribotide isomerase
MNPFTVFPAIDLRGGEVVRLAQGDPNRKTIYGDRAASAAARWLEAGADWLHIINLDGAFGEADQPNQGALADIVKFSKKHYPGCRIQLGGGLRNLPDIDRALELGVDRVILGTMTVEDPPTARAALSDFGGDQVVIGIDVRAGRVAVRGWTRTAEHDPVQLGLMYREAGATTTIFTDISRDGMGVGAGVTGAAELARDTGLEVIVAGGVRTLTDVVNAREAGLRGVVIGRALYEGQIDLMEALAC